MEKDIFESHKFGKKLAFRSDEVYIIIRSIQTYKESLIHPEEILGEQCDKLLKRFEDLDKKFLVTENTKREKE